MSKPVRLFYTGDIHGSDVCFRKWINAATALKVDALVFGGDIAGKVLVPIVKRGPNDYIFAIHGEEQEVGSDGLERIRTQVRRSGRYDVVLSADEKQHYDAHPELVDEDLFPRVARESLRGWIELAEQRLSASGVPAFVQLGNDDFPELVSILEGNKQLIHSEDRIIELPGGYEMVSLGYSNPTPWDTARELEEAELGERLENLASSLRDPHQAVFNVHVPPFGTKIDEAALLDSSFRPHLEGSQVATGPVGSTAVRAAIEQFQPLLGLHGHIHESPGTHRLGRTVVMNPGSEYSDGVLRGLLIQLDKRKGVRSWQFING